MLQKQSREVIGQKSINFQAESKYSGDEFERRVEHDLLARGYKILSSNSKIKDIGINVDFIAETDKGEILYIEAKGGKPGPKKRPGAERTDNVKKALLNGFLLKTKEPNANYIVYFSAEPKKNSSSAEMLHTALNAGAINEVRYLTYEIIN